MRLTTDIKRKTCDSGPLSFPNSSLGTHLPELTGTYEQLRPRSIRREYAGVELQVAHIDELLAKLTVPRRDKDIDRVAALREIQRQQ